MAKRGVNMKKRILALVMSVMVAALSFAGCGSDIDEKGVDSLKVTEASSEESSQAQDSSSPLRKAHRLRTVHLRRTAQLRLRLRNIQSLPR